VNFTGAVVSVVISVGLLCPAQNTHPVPPGARHAQELEAQNEPDFNQPGSVRPAVLQGEANQLANLAASVPQSVQNANKGVLEKDLLQKLKQIEKLSKHLRSELNH
jgi:hypothetical protein